MLLPTSRARTPIGSPYGSLSPEGEDVRGCQVPLARVRGVRCLLSAERPVVHDAAFQRRTSRLHRLLAPASQPLWLVIGNDLYHRFRYLHHTQCLALTRMRFPGGEASHDFSPAPPCASVHCLASTLFMAVDSLGGTGGSLPIPGGTTHASDFLSHLKLLSPKLTGLSDLSWKHRTLERIVSHGHSLPGRSSPCPR